MEYRILGPLEVIENGAPIDIGSPQQRALLALLILNDNRVVATERILEDLWPGDPIGKERTLWVYISRLRAVLEPERQARGENTVLVTRDHGYSLTADRSAIDVHRFEELAARGRGLLRHDPASAGDVLNEALSLWRGSALEDFAYLDFVAVDAARLEDLRLAVTEDRVDADIRSGRHREVIGELEQLIAANPHQERFVGHLMTALYRSGRQADALRVFERHRRTLGDDLGLEPSPELRRIEEQVLLHDPLLAPPSSPHADAPLPAVNPFKGLQAFAEADSQRFFGRERLVAELVRRIADGSRLVALVGASGSGKSSALHAGLVPAIRKSSVDDEGPWLVARMVPGSRPLQEAEAALLRSTLDSPDSLTELLADPENGLLRACLRVLPGDGARLLLVIDQFEELFTLGATGQERDRFIHNLEVLTGDPYGRVVVAIGLRADFYGRPLEYPVFARLLADGIANVVPLTPDELETAAEAPAARVDTRLESALLVQLLQDIAGQSGGLPLFQYALTELFDRRDGAVLTLDVYQAMGGVSGAIARRAEDLFLALDSAERDAAKQLFLRLVMIVEQVSWARRRVSGSEIVTIASDLVALQKVVDKFAAHRLLTLDRDPVSGSPTVEVAHEALLHQWPRLRRWIDEGQHDVVTHARLAIAMSEWEASDRQTDYLLSGQRLADYEKWAAVSSLRPSTAERTFLDQSIVHRESESLAEEQRVAREMRLGRTARRRLWELGTVVVVVVAGLVASAIVFVSDGEPTIAVVHGVVGDLGIADLMIAGSGSAERDQDIPVDLVQPLVSAEDDLRRLAEAGTDMIIVGREFDLAVERIAPDYPDVQWVAIDPAAVHIEEPNLAEMHFEVEDSAFVAGAAAALTTETKHVAFIGGYQTFRTERSRNGFEQGVRWIDPSIEVVSTFLGPMADPVVRAEMSDDAAQELARSLYADGVDLIFHDAGAAGFGVTRAANEWTDEQGHVWTIGSDVDEYLTLPVTDRDVVLTSTVKRFDIATNAVIAAYLDGSLESGETMLGFADDGVGLSRSGDFLTAIDGRLANLEGDLEFGHIQVSPHAERPPGWQLEADVTVDLTLTEDGCSVDRITFLHAGRDSADVNDSLLQVERGSIVRFEMTNATSDVAGFAVRAIPPGTTIEVLEAEAAIGSGPPASLQAIHGITTAQLGGRTGTAALVAGSPLVPSCIQGVPQKSATDHYPMIVRPS